MTPEKMILVGIIGFIALIGDRPISNFIGKIKER